jgi:hypothetical protein
MRMLLGRTRIRKVDVDLDGFASDVWFGLLRHTAKVGLLREFVEVAAGDPVDANDASGWRGLYEISAAPLNTG